LEVEHIAEAVFDECDGEVCDVDADPASVEFLGGDDGGAAAAEGVEDGIALVAGGLNNAFQQGERLLRRVAEALAGVCPDWRDVVDNVRYQVALLLVQVAFR
jgi:hypothetical protein